MRRFLDRLAAVIAAVLAHGAFVAAVGSMAYSLMHGLQNGQGHLLGLAAVEGNLVLVLQFPLLHSFLLRGRGRRLMAKVLPGDRGKTLVVTTFAFLASCQLLVTFWLWTPTGIVWYAPEGAARVAHLVLFASAWLFLIKALYDAGLGLQTGSSGWLALWRGRRVDFGSMPTGGLFRSCRQPIYLGFALVLWTAPVWSPDLLLLAFGWSLYCVLGPLQKEARWQRLYGEAFTAYRQTVPYFVPRLRR